MEGDGLKYRPERAGFEFISSPHRPREVEKGVAVPHDQTQGTSNALGITRRIPEVSEPGDHRFQSPALGFGSRCTYLSLIHHFASTATTEHVIRLVSSNPHLYI